jgi:hypothetical protein
MRSRPWPTWIWRPLLSALAVGLAGCGSGTWGEPTPTPLAARTDPAATLVSHDGKTFAPGEPDREPRTLMNADWREISFQDGRVTLHGLTQDHGWQLVCARVDHVEIGPTDANLRRVTVKTEYPQANCDEPQDVVLVPGPSWRQSTVATPGELDVPNPRLTDHRKLAGRSAVLQPDRRSLVVAYWFGGCSDLATAAATLRGREILVRVEIGVERDLPDDMGCSGDLRFGQTLVRLPEQAPEDATIRVAR